MAYTPQLGVAVGLELEVVSLTEGGARSMIEHSRSLGRWQMHHDGSTLQPGFQITGLPYTVRKYRHEHNGPTVLGRQVSTGAEIVSPILDTTRPEWKDQVAYLCDWLRDTAHEMPGTFTSTHVHTSSAGLPLYTLKNLLRIWRFLEAPIFRLSVGEMGFHRGKVRKEYAYCRPMSSPLVIFDQNGAMRHSFDVGCLLKAETLEDFFLGYGATNPQTEPIRYHPARYCAFNLLPLLTLQTVELRTMNESTDPRTIITWVELAKAIVTAAFTTKGLGDDDYPQLPLGYSGDFDLGTMQTLLELSDTVMAGVERLWNLADWQTFDGVPLFNSNNENLTLNFPRSAPTLPPVIDGTPVMMYAPTGSGRNSEDSVYVFHDRASYRSATSNSPVSVEEGRALVLANFRGVQTEAHPQVEASPESTRPEPRPGWTWTVSGPTTTSSGDTPIARTDEQLARLRDQMREMRMGRQSGRWESIAPNYEPTVVQSPWDDPLIDFDLTSSPDTEEVEDHDEDDEDDQEE